MKRKLMLLLACLFVGIGLVTAQTQKVTGVVISEEDGQPVIGASVLVKGTQIGAITNVDGDFTLLNVPSSAKTLQISFVGMQTQEVTIKPNVKVVMKSDSEMLDEVMVVAYGTAKKSSFTGAASSVSGDKTLKDIPVSSFEEALAGSTPGLTINSTSGQPGAGLQIRVRGTGSMNATNEPLYVIDGVPVVSGDIAVSAVNNDSKAFNVMASINPSDIENITVLKDAAAASLYGSRAANGVILITTKHGKAGKTRINFKANWYKLEWFLRSYARVAFAR
jgi:TonB-dependent SusC/RagA subfamily outer membrane receptor